MGGTTPQASRLFGELFDLLHRSKKLVPLIELYKAAAGSAREGGLLKINLNVAIPNIISQLRFGCNASNPGLFNRGSVGGL